jgi:acetyltransferase
MKKHETTAAKPRRISPAAGLIARRDALAKPHTPGVTDDFLRADQAQPLHSIFSPRSIAVIGATEAPGSVGRTVFENLRAEGFKGAVYPVNPKRPTVLGVPAFPNIAAVPKPVDLVIIATPAVTVPGIVAECVAADIPGAIILSAGFKEIGAEGAKLEQQILAAARKGRLRIIGPNCMGIMGPHLGLNATFASPLARPGKVAFISQSGALCSAILDWSRLANVGFSAFVSVGSMLDVNWGDLIYYLGDDPHTRSIVIYMESIGDARSFLSAAREVALTKPIIVIKVGRTDAAARVAASHTGSLTGSDEVLDAAFRRVGVLRVNTIGELFEMAEVLSKQPSPKGPRLAVVTNAGGPSALATDMLVTTGGQLATLGADTFKALNDFLPAPWSHNNPVDILGDGSAERYEKALDIVARDPGNDGLLVIFTPQTMSESTATAERLAPLALKYSKPILASWMGGVVVQDAVRLLNQAQIPTFEYPDTAARAFTYMWRYSENLRALYETPSIPGDSDHAAQRDVAATLIEQARKSGNPLLSEFDSKKLLAAYGIPTVETRIATTEEEAVACAEKLGYPIVLKLYSETITHKTDVGGVQLNLADATAVRRAWNAIQASVTEKAGRRHFQGVTVQKMIKLEGYELILGSSVDSQFGPVLLFGAGGQLVEVFKDRALALPPLNATLARRMMEQTRVYTALKGVRGRKPVDLAELEQILVRFSRLVVEQPLIKEIDINPLLASPDGFVALDARVIVHGADVPENALPRPAIRPYPIHYVAPAKLKSGVSVTIRPIMPEDEPLLVRFHSTLSEDSVYSRYMAPLQLAQRVAHERLTRVCFIDYDREMALVAERKAPGGEPEVIGVGRLIKSHGVNQAEFAVIVADAFQGSGLGTELLRRLIQFARDEKLERIVGCVLPTNRRMLQITAELGFESGRPESQSPVIVELDLASPRAKRK